MFLKFVCFIVVVPFYASLGFCQNPFEESPKSSATKSSATDAGAWQATGSSSILRTAQNRGGNRTFDAASNERDSIALLSKGTGTLPNDHGQIWREYDITPFTDRATKMKHPEQAIVDWIVRATGHKPWHSDIVAMLSADRRKLRVYHTPEMVEIVEKVIKRFVNPEGATHTFGIRLATLNSASWRARALHMLRPVPTKTEGLQAWLLSKEDAALLVSQLRRRGDYREHSSPQRIVHNGQLAAISTFRSKSYIRSVKRSKSSWPGFDPEMGKLDQGYALQFKPLLSLDGRHIEAVIKYDIHQVEKMVNVSVDVATPLAPRQRTEIQVPQISSWRMDEMIRWPENQVLLISTGLVASPIDTREGGLKIPLISPPPRVDTLILIESKGLTGKVPNNPRTSRRTVKDYQGRY